MEFEIIYMNSEMEELKQKYETDSGWDLRVNLDTDKLIMEPNKKYKIGTGVKIDILEGYGAYALPRSSTSDDLDVHLSTGTIDARYQGEISIIARNMRTEPLEISQHQKIAQLVFFTKPDITLKRVDKFSRPSPRGTNGFGSSGKF